jgi:hypothetical protein
MIASAIVWRIVWKELRQLAPVWAVVLAVSAFVLFSLRQFTEAPVALGLALAFLSAFGGCLTALMLFAMEHDNQTVRFLQHLPQTRRLVVTTKITLGLLGTLILYFFVAGVNSIPVAYQHYEYAARFGWHISFFTRVDERVWLEIALFTGLWGFLIACLTSAMIKRSLPAGLVAMALLGLLAVASFGSSWWDSQAANLLFSEQGERLTSASRIFNFIGLALLFGASLIVGRGWLDSETKDESDGLFRWFGRRKQPSNEFVSSKIVALPGRRAGQRTKLWTVLFWLEMRQSSLSIAIFLLAGIGIAIALQFVKPFSHYYLFTYAHFLGPLLALVTLSLLAGTLAFWPDQARDTKRFFWQHSLNGRTIWWVRLLPWLAVVFVLTVVFAFANQQFFRMFAEMFAEKMLLDSALASAQSNSSSLGKLSPEILTALAAYWRPGSHLLFFGLIALGVGQFFSLIFRNGLVALSCAIIVGPLVIYYVAHVVSKGEQAIWFAAPWGLCWFFASWYLAKPWIDGTLTWRGRTGAIAFLLTAFIVQFAAFAYHRAFEYPKTDWLEQVKNETANGDELVEIAGSLNGSWEGYLATGYPGDDSGAEVIYVDSTKQSARFGPPMWPQDLSTEQLERIVDSNNDRLDIIQKLVFEGSLLPRKSTMAEWQFTCSWVQRFLNSKAELHLRRGQLEDSLTCYLTTLKIELANPNAPYSDVFAKSGQALLRWAEHPQQTIELIDKASERLLLEYGGTRSAYYLALAKEKLRDDRNKASGNSWWNPLSQPWEVERDHRLTQLDLYTFHLLKNFGMESNNTKNAALYFFVYSDLDNLTRIRLREFLLKKRGQFLSRLIKDNLNAYSLRQNYYKESQAFPLDVWRIAADSSNRFLTVDQSEFDRLDNSSNSRKVNLGYLLLRFQFQKFWLTNKRFPTTEEGMNILFAYYRGTPYSYRVPFEYSFYEIQIQNEGTVFSAVRSELPILRSRLPVHELLGKPVGYTGQLIGAAFTWHSESSRLKPNIADGPATTGEQKAPE